MPHGALRAVAELFYGKQTEHTITLAGGWLRRRSHYTTGFLLESLAERVHPRFVVEKSPALSSVPSFYDVHIACSQMRDLSISFDIPEARASRC